MTSPGYFYGLGFLCAYHSLKTLALEKFLLSKFLYQCYLLEDFPDSSQLMFFFFSPQLLLCFKDYRETMMNKK